jgi:hypothetical protein
MRKTLLYVLIIFTASLEGLAQEVTLRIPIIRTETVTEEDEDEQGNIISVTFEASSDDAEQENQEIDALFDDDIDAGWEGEEGDANILTAGMRFQSIMVPRGATITSAYIEVVSHEAKTADDVSNLTIYAEKVANAATFSEDALITDRASTDATVIWTVDEEWGLWTTHQTPDLSAIVQELVDLSDWVPGNAIAFVVAGEDQGPSEVENAREWESFENIADPEDGGDGQNHPDRVPMLVINYTPGTSGALGVTILRTETVTEEDEDDDGNVFSVTFEASSDDAEQENDEIDALFDDDIDAGWEGTEGDANTLTAGMRFQNLGIPQGATIDSAFIVVYSHEAKTAEDVANLTIYAEDTDNAATFTEDALITDRTSTTAQVSWIVAEEWGLWTPHSTPDLSELIQEIVDRSGWAPGNAIAFVFQGEDQGPSEVENAREWESFENIADPEDGGDGQNHPERVPRLVVYYGGYEGPAISIGSGNEVILSSENDPTPVTVNKLYPNPAQTEVTLILPSVDAAVINIVGMDGAQALKTIYNNQRRKEVQLDISPFEAGVYFITVNQSGNTFSKRLIVK